MKKLEVVVGGQFGSEAKGHVVQRLTQRAQKQGTPQVIRVAGPNAGHTAYDAGGRPWALRQVPVAAVTGGPAILGIAAGSEIDLPVLLDEVQALREAGHMANKLLWVSEEATMVTENHKHVEGNRNLIGRIGSTGKGIGAARADRIMREGIRLKDHEYALGELANFGVAIATADLDPGKSYDHHIIEGTQGFGLGLHAGFYPQCTSSDCRAQDFIAMAGYSPWNFDVSVWVVARIFPIRVAGNSGPLKDETTWKQLGLPEERTTVTKKVRRVGLPDWELVARAVRANGGAPTVRLAVTMLDQRYEGIKDKVRSDWTFDDVREIDHYLMEVERLVDAEIGLVTTGPDTASFMGIREGYTA